jgi:hypothetical protein
MTTHPVKAIPFNKDEFPAPDPRPVCLFVGIFSPTYNSDYMVRGFEENGYRCEILDWQKVKYQATVDYNTVVENGQGQFEEKTVKENGIAVLQDTILKKAMKCNPDLIFLHIQSEGILNTLIVDQLQRIANTVIYNFDCRTPEQTQWLYDLVPYVKLVCFSNLEDVMACMAKGHFNTMVLQSSADYEVYRPLPNRGAFKAQYPHDIVFIGNKSEGTNLNFPEAKVRTEMVEFLQKEYGERFKAYGMGWKFSKLVNQQEEVAIYNSCKIAITQNNFQRVDYQSDRIYRAMGCGAFVLAQHFPNINKYFNNDVCGAWLDKKMLLEQVNRYLENDELRIKKANAGAEFVRAKHSWGYRVNQLVIALKNVKKDSL